MRIQFQPSSLLAGLIISLLLISSPTRTSAQSIQLKYQPAPIDNPLKGLVPYWHQHGPFPCSMEFWYFPVNKLMLGPDQFDWSAIESKLEDARSRGNQMVIRTYLEYPGRPSAMPDFLQQQGVKTTRYENDGKVNLTPDYHDARLIKAMESFIKAFGKKYDGDPRVAFITMGIIGHWGEWHTYPKEELFPSKESQTRIQDAFATAFRTTKVLMRYPAGNDDWAHAANDQHPVGYHDDSFAWATLDTGKKDDDWFFEPALRSAGKAAVDKWKKFPIGGEIRPEVWGCVFDEDSCEPAGQEFDKCVERTHVSWLMDSGMFALADPPPTKQRIANATQSVRRMGYEFHIPAAKIRRTKTSVSVTISIENRGVAPFYYQWPVELVGLSADNREISSVATNWKLPAVMPDQQPQEWTAELSLFDSLFDGDIEKVAIRVPNPMPGGKPIRFANQSQRSDGLMLIE